MKKAIIILCVLLLTGGVAIAADIEGYVEPGVPFTMGWTPSTGNPTGYLIERNLNGTGWVPLQSILVPQYEDALVADGDASQYRVKGYRDDTYTDADGTHTTRILGPVSDVSDTLVARTGGAPGPIGACGKPGLVP